MRLQTSLADRLAAGEAARRPDDPRLLRAGLQALATRLAGPDLAPAERRRIQAKHDELAARLLRGALGRGEHA